MTSEVGPSQPAERMTPVDVCSSALRELFERYDLSVEIAGLDGFYDLVKLAAHGEVEDIDPVISNSLVQLRKNRGFVSPCPLNVTDPASIHSKIYAGYDYSAHGPVLVNPKHLEQIFSGFQKPSNEEIEARSVISKANYGTMPGTESAYAGAIVKAMQPRSIFIIGEHTGHLTEYLARCSPDDCLIMTLDLPQAMLSEHTLTEVDPINRSYINYRDDQIGEVWRKSSSEHASRIIGLAGDSQSSHSIDLFDKLQGCFDLVVVDGNHSFDAVKVDLASAERLLCNRGVILLDDFWKPARLFEVTEAALVMRRELENLKHLYHISWGVGEDAISSNLAFFIKQT